MTGLERTGAVERLKTSLRLVSNGVLDAEDIFRTATARVGTLVGILKAELKLAELRYAVAHGGRLPGSERTARLRKKRRDAVLRWWREQ